MELDWDIITNQDFEELCYDILDKEGFVNLTWMGRSGGDRGRDITGIKSETPMTGIQRDITYLVQCKKYVSRPPVPSDLNNTIAWANAHRPNVIIIMVSNILSSGTNDWINDIKKTVSYDIIIYDLKKLEKFLEENEEIYKKFFESEKGYYYNKIKDLKIEIINKLINVEKLTAENLSTEIGAKTEDLKNAIQELYDEKIIDGNDKNEYYLIERIDAFNIVSKYMLNTNYKYVFLLSSYANKMINLELIKYITTRYYVTLSEEELTQLHVLVSISPSCLNEALFSNTIKYENSAKHVETLNYSKEEAEKYIKMTVNQIFMRLMQLSLIDANNPEGNNILKEVGIRGIDIKLEINMANMEKLIFGVDSHAVIMILKASGPIEAGQLVSATNPDLFLESSMILMNLRQNDLALKDINLALEEIENPDQLKIAWNNKGVILLRMNKFEDAIDCFDKALVIDPNLEQAKNNRQFCVEQLERA